MIGQDRSLKHLKAAVKRSNLDQVELLMVARESGCTRFANSLIHQNVFEERVTVFIRTLDHGGVGLTKVPSLEEDMLSEGIRKASETGRRLTPEKGFETFPAPQPYKDVAAFSEETAKFRHLERADRLKDIFAEAATARLRMAGAFTTGAEEVALVNSNGIEAYHRSTSFEVAFTALSERASGFACRVGTHIRDLNPQVLAQEAMGKALAGSEPVVLPPGKYTVILDPKALAELLEWTSYIAFGARRYQEGTSFIAGKIGEQIVGEQITLYDDALEPGGFPRPFDYEGVPKHRFDLIRGGKAAGVVYDTRYGSREGKNSTGHATLPSSEEGPLPLNLYMEPGDRSRDEILSSTERAILITRFHYVNGLLEPEVALMTGMTRDGTFLVEGGVITHRVEDLRFTDSVLRILNHVTAISRERESIKSWWSEEGVYTIPAVRVEGMTFTGKTG